jgi:hypothetical protein
MSDQTIGLHWVATAEVVSADPERAEACVAAHPGEPCPGWPHDSGDTE